ncbi:MAG: ubiquinone/menaquinone biosynthesis methyltransferase [Candidatus Binataceae bacterium]|jgi:demethylmenaquinone methyltransferase/2-methoxy-6-polyprenyl-1,4-benzoquinol methylase
MDAGVSKAAYVRSMFGRIVPRYDLINRLMTMGQDVRWRRVAAGLAKPDGRLALDVGSGTADLALELERHGARAVIAVDFCGPMMDAARGKLARQGRESRVFLAAGDAMCLPFADNTFGCLVNGFVLRNVADLEATMAEFYRVLEPGGQLACLELTHAPAPIEALFGLYFNHMMPRLGALVSGQGDAYRYLSRSLDGYPDADALAAMMVRAGFTAVKYVRLGLGSVAIHLGQKPAK